MTFEEPAARRADSYHHGNLRQALIDAALARIDQEGAAKVSLAKLARALNVSQGAPYRHFADRDELLAAVASEGFRLFIEALRAARQAKSDGRTLLRMAHAYVDFGLARPGLYRLMFDSNLLAKAPTEELNAVSQGSFDLLVAALPETAPPAERRRRAVGVWVGLHGAVMLASRNLLESPTTAISIDDLLEDILR